MSVQIRIADYFDLQFAEEICAVMETAAKQRGTGIAKRKPEYVQKKMKTGNAVIAFVDDQLAGFCYVETWDHGKYIANSGLIVFPEFRGLGLARKIKARIFQLSREKYPHAKVFGITTSLAVMKINSDLGYKPVTFSELPKDETFWKGCSSCVNYDILTRTDRKMCLCTGMLADPVELNKKSENHAIEESRISL
ncbi:MAG: GNAT family N-acetyltransferase [Bacteroidota bacterium]